MDKNSEKYDYGYDSGSCARGLGVYVGKAYEPTITVLCEVEGMVLRAIKGLSDKYEILWDGELLNRYPNRKTAETFFIDFAGITKAKYNKLKVA